MITLDDLRDSAFCDGCKGLFKQEVLSRISEDFLELKDFGYYCKNCQEH